MNQRNQLDQRQSFKLFSFVLSRKEEIENFRGKFSDLQQKLATEAVAEVGFPVTVHNIAGAIDSAEIKRHKRGEPLPDENANKLQAIAQALLCISHGKPIPNLPEIAAIAGQDFCDNQLALGV
jgi:hypothetical protein